ncbi:MAG: hypothetical protein HSCHL_1295 [Hydrogenibacillus schlegelii]|uniref:Putative Flp pilus-assembly TadG-like N-terminal domain-containing protein n=1 Tax=Hydrogenibacillus schlegelii TaxID=1484 RepID=A0A2T5G5X6_HYDSH|nr:pilus assembly protein TadG-related protein [Hydrogenibacillus schlegelii]PTQ51592.1 MAG: hypothetical protein HSCHL_1295 [Hydrogenibacillus schlegelii]
MIRKDDRGSATLWFVYFLPVLLVVLVLAFDLARAYAARVALKQSAALAARAAAMELDADALAGSVVTDANGNVTVTPPKLALTGNADSTFRDVLTRNTGGYGSLIRNVSADVWTVNEDPAMAKKYGTAQAPTVQTWNGYRVEMKKTGVIGLVRATVDLSPLARMILGKQALDISVITAAAPEMRP